MTLIITYFTHPYFARKAKHRVHFHHAYSRLDARVCSPTCARHVGECLSTGLADDRQCEMTSKGRCNMQARVFFFFANNIMHKYSDNRPSRSSRSIGVSYITVTRKHSSRRLCTQLGRATLDLMFKSRITTTRPIRFFFCYKVGLKLDRLALTRNVRAHIAKRALIKTTQRGVCRSSTPKLTMTDHD